MGFSAVVAFLGCGAAARRGGRRRGPLVPAHMSDEAGKAHESWAPRRTRESPVEWAGRLWCRASRHDVRSYAGRRGRPARHQLRARKDGRSPACCRELKMEDAAARESGRVSHPHKGKGPFPVRPLLPVTLRCTERRLGTSILPQRLKSRPSPEWGRGF